LGMQIYADFLLLQDFIKKKFKYFSPSSMQK